eukprot:GHVN01077371.1.p1 GENE.GHVN01077371.1~~GHVN01077371.1.p1  ORF type:complete len:111 (+),score=11.95 GHVN01077371.1:212-544(+)
MKLRGFGEELTKFLTAPYHFQMQQQQATFLFIFAMVALVVCGLCVFFCFFIAMRNNEEPKTIVYRGGGGNRGRNYYDGEFSDDWDPGEEYEERRPRICPKWLCPSSLCRS